MRTRFEKALPVLGMLALAVVVATCKGDDGATGPEGDPGVAGPPGMPGAPLPSGSTMRGAFVAWNGNSAAGEYTITGVAYVFNLSAAATPHFIAQGTAPPAGCPGTATTPQASPGHLCLYEVSGINREVRVCATSGACVVSSPWGFMVELRSPTAGSSYTYGAWAVTAP